MNIGSIRTDYVVILGLVIFAWVQGWPLAPVLTLFAIAYFCFTVWLAKKALRKMLDAEYETRLRAHNAAIEKEEWQARQEREQQRKYDEFYDAMQVDKQRWLDDEIEHSDYVALWPNERIMLFNATIPLVDPIPLHKWRQDDAA